MHAVPVLSLLVCASLFIFVRADPDCECHEVPTCRCERNACHCKQSASPPCVCRIPDDAEFRKCHSKCLPSCIASCLSFSPIHTCTSTCMSACSSTCTQTIKTAMLARSLSESCANDCLADCLLSTENRKFALADDKVKKSCQSRCDSACTQTVNGAVADLPSSAVLFAVRDTNLKAATYSKQGCKQTCLGDCNEKCSGSGVPDEICTPTCEGFCADKCSFQRAQVPQVMCMKACQPDCDRSCVLSKTLDTVFGFVDITKNLTAGMPSLEELLRAGGGGGGESVGNVVDLSRGGGHVALPVVMTVPLQPLPPPQPLPTPAPEITLPRTFHSFNCKHLCLPSCQQQCADLHRPALNCTRLCERTCDLNCGPQSPSLSFHSFSQSEMQSKCRDQLTLKCSALCQSSECAEICTTAARFLCTRSAECNGVCQRSCTQHCVVKDKAFSQCEPHCAEACLRECRLSEAIRNECQGNCMGNCGRKCEITSPTGDLKTQCNMNCPQLCHSVCFE